MGPALTPPYGFLHAPTDEAACEPEGRPTPHPAKGPTTCARRREGRGVLKAAPQNPGFTIDGSPLGADSSSLGGTLRNVGKAAAGESEDPPLSCLRGGEGGLEGINTSCSLRVLGCLSSSPSRP